MAVWYIRIIIFFIRMSVESSSKCSDIAAEMPPIFNQITVQLRYYMGYCFPLNSSRSFNPSLAIFHFLNHSIYSCLSLLYIFTLIVWIITINLFWYLN